MQPGDRLLCYLTGVSRFIGILEVTSEAFMDQAPIWSDDEFPCRVRVRILISLEPETAVPVHELREELSAFAGDNPRAWTGRFRGSPSQWNASDGEAVVRALEAAERNPVRRPVDLRRLNRRPRGREAPTGEVVTIPDAQSPSEPEAEPTRAASEHTEIQYLLLKLGADVGFGVWVARNDRNREWEGVILGQMPGARPTLPVQFDPVTNQTIQLIDVLWLQGRSIVAAFEVESTTSIYSGLLRMADLVAMQPNLNIPLYIVAPDERRETVLAQVNRPAFSRLDPPLASLCSFIPFSALRQRMQELGEMIRYLRPDFLEQVAEPCELEGA